MRARASWAAAIILAAALTGCAGGGAAPEPTESSGEKTAIDGTYRWSTPEEQAIGTPAEKDIGTVWPVEGIASVPNTFTIELDRGEWTWQGTLTRGVDRGTYEVDGDTLEMTWVEPLTGWTLTFEFSVDPDGTLHMRSIGEMAEPVNEFVFTHNPWERIG